MGSVLLLLLFFKTDLEPGPVLDARSQCSLLRGQELQRINREDLQTFSLRARKLRFCTIIQGRRSGLPQGQINANLCTREALACQQAWDALRSPCEDQQSTGHQVIIFKNIRRELVSRSRNSTLLPLPPSPPPSQEGWVKWLEGSEKA